MTASLVLPSTTLECADCGMERAVTTEVIEAVCRKHFPSRAPPAIYSTDLPRFMCISCKGKSWRVKDVREIQTVPFTPSEQSKASDIVQRYLNQTTRTEQKALLSWAQGLLTIRQSNVSALQKAKDAILLTVESKTVGPFLQYLGAEIKRVGWDERGLPERIALSAAAVAALAFSGQGAGIAALGGAIGVPLWVVFGAGGAFIGVLIERVQRSAGESEKDADDGKNK